jgi:hypothetical protein
MKPLSRRNLVVRRAFIKSLAKKSAVPVIAIFCLDKSAPRLFAREPE